MQWDRWGRPQVMARMATHPHRNSHIIRWITWASEADEEMDKERLPHSPAKPCRCQMQTAVMTHRETEGEKYDGDRQNWYCPTWLWDAEKATRIQRRDMDVFTYLAVWPHSVNTAKETSLQYYQPSIRKRPICEPVASTCSLSVITRTATPILFRRITTSTRSAQVIENTQRSMLLRANWMCLNTLKTVLMQTIIVKVTNTVMMGNDMHSNLKRAMKFYLMKHFLQCGPSEYRLLCKSITQPLPWQRTLTEVILPFSLLREIWEHMHISACMHAPTEVVKVRFNAEITKIQKKVHKFVVSTTMQLPWALLSNRWNMIVLRLAQKFTSVIKLLY